MVATAQAAGDGAPLFGMRAGQLKLAGGGGLAS